MVFLYRFEVCSIYSFKMIHKSPGISKLMHCLAPSPLQNKRLNGRAISLHSARVYTYVQEEPPVVSCRKTGWFRETTSWSWRLQDNVWGEPVFNVIAAGWFCEKSGWIGKVEDVKSVLAKKNRISTGNHFEEEDFYLHELWNRQISSGMIHLRPGIIWYTSSIVLGFSPL